MTITTFTKSPRYPVPGQPIVFTAADSGSTVNEFRFRLTGKPNTSSLELWDAGKGNYLRSDGATTDTGVLVPDVDGAYTVAVDEEVVTANVPHYSNDGGVGESVGVVTRTVDATTSGYFYVGCPVARQIGFAPDQVTLTVTAHSWHSTGLGDGFAVSGVMTYYADATLAPRLDGWTSERALEAMRAATVAAKLALVGGYGYTGTLSVMPWSYLISADPISDLGWTIIRLNEHIGATTLYVHASADAANVVTAADAAVGNAASQKALLDDILVQFTAHWTAGCHHDSDTVNTLPSALPGSPTAAELLAQCVDLLEAYDGHCMTGRLSLLTVTYVHKAPGDQANRPASLTPTTETTSVAAMNALKAKYNLHRVVSTISGSTAYHDIAGTDEAKYMATAPGDVLGYVAAVNECLDVLGDHALNRQHTDKATSAYHTTPDWLARTDVLPRATDFGTALALHWTLDYLLGVHANRGTVGVATVHSKASSAGYWAVAQTGVAALHSAYYAALIAQTPATPAGEIPSTFNLIHLGGFSKV